MKSKKNKEATWCVIVTCLIADEKEPTKLLTREYMTEIQAHTAEISCWRVCKMIWVDAAKQQLSLPICGVKAITKEQYDEAVRSTKEQEATKKGEDEEEPEEPITKQGKT